MESSSRHSERASDGSASPSHLDASASCGVATPVIPLGHFPRGRAPRASASTTIGIPCSVAILNIAFTASMVRSSLPRPGPITIESGLLPDWVNAPIDAVEDMVRRSPSGSSSGMMLFGHSHLLAAFEGMATWTRSHPLRAAAIPASMGAPWYGPPPITRSLPRSPFLAPGSSGG